MRESVRSIPLEIAGARLLELPVFLDERGGFMETYVRSQYAAIGLKDAFVQDSISWSSRNVLRGLHGHRGMSKLAQVLTGCVYDVVVDARPESPTFMQWQGIELADENRQQLYVPAGCLHGFLVLSEQALMSYKLSSEYDFEGELNVRWDDPQLNITWPLPDIPTLSTKDAGSRLFAEELEKIGVGFYRRSN